MSTANRSRRRRQRGSAWHWKQTDCWYYTPPGTKRRVRLLDEADRPIRGPQSRPAAELALARIKAAGDWLPEADAVPREEWLVARVCSEYIEDCQQRAARGSLTQEYCQSVVRHLNDLCSYCGGLPVSQLTSGHVQHWVESHSSWRSPVTQRNVLGTVLAAFHHAEQSHEVPSPLRGLKKPPPRPRLVSFSGEEEQQLYSATDAAFRDFLFAAIHTGLRPFCELARLQAEDIVQTERGMMWRVYSSKTKTTRKIPVRQEVAGLTERLLATAPCGSGIPLFRNAQGRPWKKVTGVGRFLRIKRVLGWDRDPRRKRYSTYTCRHTFAHRMLAGYWNGGEGCSIEVLAELLGDTPKVAFDHYGREWGQQYQEPLWEAIGVPPASRQAAPGADECQESAGKKPIGGG